MNENYLMLNGKRVDLTEEQIKKLGLKTENDHFAKNSHYYYIDDSGEIEYQTSGIFDTIDNDRYNAANYCTNETLMKQRALHETLSRLLWRFNMQNDGEKIDWDPVSDHCLDKYCIAYDYYDKRFKINSYEFTQFQGAIYFHKKEIAQRAIDEIIVPFMKEHPDFVW